MLWIAMLLNGLMGFLHSMTSTHLPRPHRVVIWHTEGRNCEKMENVEFKFSVDFEDLAKFDNHRQIRRSQRMFIKT